MLWLIEQVVSPGNLEVACSWGPLWSPQTAPRQKYLGWRWKYPPPNKSNFSTFVFLLLVSSVRMFFVPRVSSGCLINALLSSFVYLFSGASAGGGGRPHSLEEVSVVAVKGSGGGDRNAVWKQSLFQRAQPLHVLILGKRWMCQSVRCRERDFSAVSYNKRTI